MTVSDHSVSDHSGQLAFPSPGDAAPRVHVAPSPPQVEVRRSTRRRRTVSAYRDGDRTIVLVPARLTRAEEQRWVATMLAQLEAREARNDRLRHGDDDLLRRARALSRRYLDGRARPSSVRWVDNQRSRWGSCTPIDRSIRLSRTLAEMPGWVLDYVILHELAHLIVPGHGPRFWALLESFPRTERARGYLDGVVAAAGLDFSGCPDGPDDDVRDELADDVDVEPYADPAADLDAGEAS